ncbi:hypothetical protein BDZ97DRAFT_1805626 [Flammula alnicola]|nr:hypothetical protein BDZ97DRAFT_1805626 [Flammula alnicola]
MSSSTSPTLPAEIIDIIVDEVAKIPDQQPRNQTLSSTALASWSFRHRAHAHLFASIHIFGTHLRSATPRIRRLLQLINADPHSEVTGIASYVRSFTVYMFGPASMVRPTLDDGTMATIYRKIYRTGEPSSGPRSLSLTLGTLGNIPTLCGNPLFTTLHLSHFINLPPTLLHHSYVKNVKFWKIRLPETKVAEDLDAVESIYYLKLDECHQDIDALEECQAVLLESIDTDHSMPLLDMLDMSPHRSLHPKVIFSKLKNLTTQIGNEDDFHKTIWILANATSSLEMLDIKLFSYNEPPMPVIECGQLFALKTLSISQSFTSYKSPGRTTIPQICKIIHHLNLPPHLDEISITVFLYTQLSERSPRDIFDGHEYSPLDELFSHARFYALKHLTIRFMFILHLAQGEILDEKCFIAQSSAYVRGSFPEVESNAVSGRLQFDIDIVPHIRRK